MSSMIESPTAETGPAGGAPGVEPGDVVSGVGADEDGTGVPGCGAGAPAPPPVAAADDGVVDGTATATGLAARTGPERSPMARPSSPSSRSTSPAAITRSSGLTLSTPPVWPADRGLPGHAVLRCDGAGRGVTVPGSSLRPATAAWPRRRRRASWSAAHRSEAADE